MTIGIFDSGLGGLTVLKEIRKRLPDYDILYLGDNARAPYGDRSGDAVTEFTRQGVEALFKRGCGLVILACVTASTLALRRLQQEWLPSHYLDRRILGIVVPLVEKMVELNGRGPVAVIGTRATIQSNVFEKEIEKRLSVRIPLIQQACPLLVPLIEEGWHTKAPSRMILRTYLRPLKLKQITSLILGCTHYPILSKDIAGMMGPRTRIIEPGGIVAESLSKYLERHPEIAATLSQSGSLQCLTTDTTDRTQSIATRFWGSVIPFKKISLE